MPTFSEISSLLRDIERLLKLMILYDDDVDTEDGEDFENMVSSRRYINERAPIPKS